MFSFFNDLSQNQREQLLESPELYFFEFVFHKINDKDFACLYPEKESRPKGPVNCLVSALILKDNKNWIYEELFQQLNFKLLIKYVLGLSKISDIPFNYKTLFNFQNKLLRHNQEKNQNLLENVFNTLTFSNIKLFIMRIKG